MRWFKHMTASADDEKIAHLIDQCGLLGYGFFWRVMELIAAQVDDSDKNYCSYSKRVWCNKLAINHQTWSKLIASCEQTGLFEVSGDDQAITVKSPNILKYRDEWTRKKCRNSGVTPEQRRSKDTDTDTDTDTEEDNKHTSSKRDNSLGNDDLGSGGGGVEPANPPPVLDEPPIEFQELRAAWNENVRSEEPLSGLDEYWQLKHGKQWPGNMRIFAAMDSLKEQDQQWIRGFTPGLAKFLRLRGWLKEPDTRVRSPATSGKSSPEGVLDYNAKTSQKILEEYRAGIVAKNSGH